MSPVPMTERDTRRDRASALNLHGLLAHWGEIASETWVASLLGWEEQERARRSLERRFALPILAASSRSATSTGPGPSVATAPSSKR